MAVRSRSIVALVCAGFVVPVACSSHDRDFIVRARDEGIVVQHEGAARRSVAQLCDDMNAGVDPVTAAISQRPWRLNQPNMSTDDKRLVEFGIETQCPQHSDAWEKAFDDS